ncbi:hypothetical protein [Evansella clarkii]|uniref:hypothetical protein n=1 Tax=Evansella clarkii TaxID=79879 RepID=UPI00099636DB|nr:hypothetical protein [Evansella clarkii]
MNSRDEQRKAKQILVEELEQYNFTAAGKVTARTHPRSFREKLDRLWNKEINIPLVPVGAALFLFLSAGSMFVISETAPDGQRELIEKGGSIYWSDLLEREESDR